MSHTKSGTWKKKPKAKMSSWRARVELEKALDVAEGRTSNGRSLSPEEIRAICEAKGLKYHGP